jgi:hypothetical protein
MPLLALVCVCVRLSMFIGDIFVSYNSRSCDISTYG